MLKKLLVLVLLIFVFCPDMGFSQTSPVPGVTWAVVDTTTPLRIIGGYRNENNVSFYEPTTGNLLFSSYYIQESPAERTITAAVSTDGGANWTVTRKINEGVGAELMAYYPVAFGNSSTPILVYYNRGNADPNIYSQPIMATDLLGWGGGLWDNLAVDTHGTADSLLDHRYHSMTIAPDNPDLWIIGGVSYEPGEYLCLYRSTNAGVTWSKQIKVATNIKADSLQSNYVWDWSGSTPGLAVNAGPNNKVYGVFQAEMESEADIERVVYVTSDDGGLTWTDPTLIPGTENLIFATDHVYKTFATLIDAANNYHIFGIGKDTSEVANSYRIWDFRFDGTVWNINQFGFPQLLNDGICQPDVGGNPDEEDVMNSPSLGPDGTLYYAYTDVYDTTSSGGSSSLYKYRIYVMISEDNGTTWQGPQWVFEQEGWASEYPVDQTRTASDKLHFFYRTGEGGYNTPKQANYMAVPTQGIKDLISSIDNPSVTHVPESHKLFQNYPNPFNPNTNIRFNLKEKAHVKLTIFNLLGQKVATLIDKEMIAGEKGITWYPKDVPSGTYFYRLQAGDFSEVKEMVFIK
ncbi:T9SS type A sorting domain-containing protein [Calditrichota bacterium]